MEKTLKVTRKSNNDGIPEGWGSFCLRDLIDIKHGFAFKGEFFSDEPTQSILLTPGNFCIGGGFKDDKFKYYDGEFPDEYILRENDLIITMTDLSKSGDTLGYPAKVPSLMGSRFLHNQRLGLVIFESDAIDKEFLYWILRTREYQRFIVNSCSGSTVKHTSPSRIKDYEFSAPEEISEQHAIAKILSDLDAKIELNHQMNKTLESIAQAIFKRWFVDFEFPGYEKTKFGNGISHGWREGNLVDTCEIVMGQSPPGETYNESGDGIVFYQGNRDFGFRFPIPRVYCTAPTRIAEVGDVLISVRAPVGALNITLERCAIGRGIAALRMKKYSNGFLFYFLLTQNDLWDRYNSEGTVFGCLNKTEFHKMQVIIPSNEVMVQFNKVIMPIEEKIRSNEEQIRALTQIRDSLLPKLMSGKIRVN